jgi:hypothetical protein
MLHNGLRAWDEGTDWPVVGDMFHACYQRHFNFKDSYGPLYTAITTGFCGSLTTFSSWQLDVFMSWLNATHAHHDWFRDVSPPISYQTMLSVASGHRWTWQDYLYDRYRTFRGLLRRTSCGRLWTIPPTVSSTTPLDAIHSDSRICLSLCRCIPSLLSHVPKLSTPSDGSHPLLFPRDFEPLRTLYKGQPTSEIVSVGNVHCERRWYGTHWYVPYTPEHKKSSFSGRLCSAPGAHRRLLWVSHNCQYVRHGSRCAGTRKGLALRSA